MSSVFSRAVGGAADICENVFARLLSRIRYRSGCDTCRWCIPSQAGSGLIHPIFGRLDNHGGRVGVAYFLQLHVPQIRRCVELNSQP